MSVLDAAANGRHFLPSRGRRRRKRFRWNPEKVALSYSVDSRWRNRSEFIQGRSAIIEFLTRKWKREFDYRLIKELWAFDQNRIAVRFAYEWHDASGKWYRSYGNENWEFAEDGLMHHRHASINDIAIVQPDRKFHWPQGPRPADRGSATSVRNGQWETTPDRWPGSQFKWTRLLAPLWVRQSIESVEQCERLSRHARSVQEGLTVI
jgi:nuclear transport factor 2 (NTF2) superfamily protein